MGKLHFWVHLAWFALRDRVVPPRRRLEEAGVGPGHTVLDYGCGGGSFTLAAAEMVGPTGRVYAADKDPLAVTRLRGLLDRRGLHQVTVMQTDCGTGLADDSVDVALLYDVYHLVGDPEAVLAELHRVLKPGGVLSFVDHFVSDRRAVERLTADGRFVALPRTGVTRSFRCG